MHSHVVAKLSANVGFLDLHCHKCAIMQTCLVYLSYGGRCYRIMVEPPECFLNRAPFFFSEHPAYHLISAAFGLVLQLTHPLKERRG